MKVRVLEREMLILESLGLDKPSFVLGVIKVHQCRRVDKYGFEHRSDKLPDDRLTSINHSGEEISLNIPFTIESVQEFFPGFNELKFSREDLKDAN